MTPILLTQAQIAERCQVGVKTIRAWTRNGTIPAVRNGRLVRYSPAAVENALAEMQPEGDQVRRMLRRMAG